MTDSFEASLLSAFFISISLNSLLLLLLDLLGQSFVLMSVCLPIVSVCLLASVIKSGYLLIYKQLKVNFDWWRFVLYSFVFIILFYNGGLIEQMADSWWHMSLANKISLASSFNLEAGHLTGESTRYYPPLWHANLGLAKLISGETIPVLWNSFTAWGGVFKVMGFYLLAFGLSANRTVAILAAALFVLLPGMGDSYLRVSAWPSHIAYTAMFCMFYVTFFAVDNYQRESQSVVASVYRNLLRQKSIVIAFIILALLILFVHQLELLWFFIAMLTYLCGYIVYEFVKTSESLIEAKNNDLLTQMSMFVLVICIGASISTLLNDWQSIKGNLDWLVICFVFIALFIVLLLMLITQHLKLAVKVRPFQLICVTTLILLIFCSVDLQHLFSLVKPEVAYSLSAAEHRPLVVEGYFDGELMLPSWDLQLRLALLYAGLWSIPLSLLLLLLKPCRLTLFVSMNALVAFLFCVSPYLYTWLANLLNYHSTWRIAILIFHPIIIAFTLHTAWLHCLKRNQA